MAGTDYLILNLIKQLKSLSFQMSSFDSNTLVHINGDETINDFKTFTELVTASGFKIPLGTSSQFLKADGSVDNTVYSSINGIGFVKANGTVLSYDNTSYEPLLGFIPEDSANKGIAGGYAELNLSGFVPDSQLPPNVFDTVVSVADEPARFALTIANVQNGDTVLQEDIEIMYYVIDDTNLNNNNGYEMYVAGMAAQVPWSGILNTPTTLAGYGITDGALDADVIHTTGNEIKTGTLTVNSIIKASGLSTEFLKADGSSDSTTYQDIFYKQNNMLPDGLGLFYPTVDAVNLLGNNSLKISGNTGFIDRLDPFTMILTNPTTITVTGSNPGAFIRTRLFSSPFAPSDAIRNISGRVINASDISLVSDGTYYRFLGYDYTTDAIIDSNINFLLNDAIVALGFVEVKRNLGVNTFSSFQMQVDISTVSLFDSFMVPNQTTTNIFPNSDLTVNNITGILKSNGISWGNLNPHVKTITSNNPLSFVRIDPGSINSGVTFPLTTIVDTTTYWDGFALSSTGNANSASVQRWLLLLDGRIVLQAGEQTFTSYSAAQSAVSTVLFTDIIPSELVIELCRMVSTKSTTNLSNLGQTQFYYSSFGGSSTSGAASFATLGGSPYDNTLLGIELNNKISKYADTLNYLPKSIGAGIYADSQIADNGSRVTVGVVDNTIDKLQVGGSIIGTSIKKTGGLATEFLKADGSVSTESSITIAATQVTATPHTEYLTSNDVQGQLDDTETSVIDLHVISKTDYKDLYQTGRLRIDSDVSILTLSPADTLTITAVDRVLFINEILIDTPANHTTDYIKDFGTKVFVADGTNTPLTVNTRGVFYVGVDKLGATIYQPGKIYDQDICYLARIVVENLAGVYSIILYKYFPDLANNKTNGRDRLVIFSGSIVPSGAASISFGNRDMAYFRNSINYSIDKFDPNYLQVADSVNPTPMSFLFLLPNITSIATSITPVTTIDPKAWYLASGALGGVDVDDSDYQVYRLMLTVTGTIAIQTIASTNNLPQPGINAIFNTKEEALAGLSTVIFPPVLPLGDSVALGTFYLRAGTATNGSQLNDINDFYYSPYTAFSSSSFTGVTAHDTLSGKNDNNAFQHVTTTDISNWNQKADSSILINTTSPLIGGGDLTTNRTISIPAATSSVNGYLTSVDWSIFNNKQPLLTNPITGTGTSGYISRFSGLTSLVDSSIYDNGINTGFGTTTPSAKITVRPATNIHSIRILQNDDATFGSSFWSNSSDGSFNISRYNAGVDFDPAFTLLPNGNTGIGTLIPQYKLEVSGGIGGSSFFKAGGLSTQYLMADGSVTTLAGLGILTGTGTANYLPRYTGTGATLGNSLLYQDANNNIGIGTISPLNVANYRTFSLNNTLGVIYEYKIADVQTGYSTSSTSGFDLCEKRNLPLRFRTNDIVRVTIDGAGNTGFGTPTPQAKVDVEGDIRTQALIITDTNNIAKYKIVYNPTTDSLDTLKL